MACSSHHHHGHFHPRTEQMAGSSSNHDILSGDYRAPDQRLLVETMRQTD
jgi:hypothetical protein